MIKLMGTMTKVEKDDGLQVIIRNENEYKLNEKQGNLVYYSPMGFFSFGSFSCFVICCFNLNANVSCFLSHVNNFIEAPAITPFFFKIFLLPMSSSQLLLKPATHKQTSACQSRPACASPGGRRARLHVTHASR